ncbi:unnamed protein product, partial [Mesorhabditis spiculigera]
MPPKKKKGSTDVPASSRSTSSRQPARPRRTPKVADKVDEVPREPHPLDELCARRDHVHHDDQLVQTWFDCLIEDLDPNLLDEPIQNLLVRPLDKLAPRTRELKTRKLGADIDACTHSGEYTTAEDPLTTEYFHWMLQTIPEEYHDEALSELMGDDLRRLLLPKAA